jgi:hypothetical protein
LPIRYNVPATVAYLRSYKSGTSSVVSTYQSNKQTKMRQSVPPLTVWLVAAPRARTHRTLITARHCRYNHPRLALEPFGPTVDQWFHRIRILWVHHLNKRRVYPSSCFYTVEAADDQLKLRVVGFVVVLNFSMVPVRRETRLSVRRLR